MDVLPTASTNLALRVGGEDPHTAGPSSLAQVTRETRHSPLLNRYTLRRRPYVSSPSFCVSVAVAVAGRCMVETVTGATEASRWSVTISGFHRCVCTCTVVHMWKSEVNLGCQSLPSALFEAGPLKCHGTSQAFWPEGFWGFSRDRQPSSCCKTSGISDAY